MTYVTWGAQPSYPHNYPPKTPKNTKRNHGMIPRFPFDDDDRCAIPPIHYNGITSGDDCQGGTKNIYASFLEGPAARGAAPLLND